jgi:hypothetical protein
MSDKPSSDDVSTRSPERRAHDALVTTVEQMRRAFDLCQETNAILNEIKNTLHAEVRGQADTFLWMEMGDEAGEIAPAKCGGLTVLQVLCERESATAFNQTDDKPPPYFVDAIQGFMVERDGRKSARKVRKTVRNAWRENPGAERRVREMERQPAAKLRSPYRGRPEIYDPAVVLAFADAIARSTGRLRISWTRGTTDNKSRGEMLDVLVAAVEWGMCVAWQSFGGPGSQPPKVNAEGIIRILKSQATLTKSTD